MKIGAAQVFNRGRLVVATTANLSTDTLKLVAVTTAPVGGAANNAGASIDGTDASSLYAGLTKATNLPEITMASAAPNGFGTTFTQTDATDKATLAGPTTAIDIFTATGATGAICGFVLYDDTVASPAKPCLVYYPLLTDADAATTQALSTGDKFTYSPPTGGIWLTI